MSVGITVVASRGPMISYRFRFVILALCIGLSSNALAACEVEEKPIPEIQAIRLESDLSRETSDSSLAFMDETDSGVPNYTIEQLLNDVGYDDFQGVVLVSEQDRIVYQSAKGRADVESGLRLDASTNFEVGRISGQVIAACIRHLIDDGLLSLDDSLSLYLPEYSYAERVTIRQLLNMSSGIPDYLDNTLAEPSFRDAVFVDALFSEKGVSAISEFAHFSVDLDAIIETLNVNGLLFEPGSSFLFSQTNYLLLAEVVQRVSGIPYVHYAQKNVLTPLGLEAAAFEQSSKTATPYVARDRIQAVIGPTNLLADAGLRMNVSDLLIWTFVVRDALKDWQNRALPVAGDDGIIPDDLAENDYRLYGVQWVGDSFMGMESEIGGFDCIQVFDAQRDIVILILSNRNSTEPLCEDMLQALLDHYSVDLDTES